MRVELAGASALNLRNSPTHSHNDWEIVLNIEGEGVTLIGEQEYRFFPGSIICYPPKIPHSKTSSSPFRDVFLQVSDVVFPFESETFFQDDEGASFEVLMLLALRVFHKKEKNYIPVVNSLFDSMLQFLISWNENAPKNEMAELFKNELINNFTDPEFNIGKAMDNIPFCNDHFRRCFKKATGKTPVAYLTDLRINYAKKLLSQKSDYNLTVVDIAHLSGFYDYHYFSRLFKSHTGLAPVKYSEKY